MLYKTYTQPYHELAKIELTYKLMFFLRDIGISSAKQPSREIWYTYMYMVASLTASS